MFIMIIVCYSTMIIVGMLIKCVWRLYFMWNIEGNDLLCTRLELDVCVVIKLEFYPVVIFSLQALYPFT